jgi:AhpD family alkylhydroperoxidase
MVREVSMPRVRFADPEQVVDPAASPGDQVGEALQAILAHRPDAAAALAAYSVALATSSTLGPRLTELIRLRIAFHNQCRSCMAVRYKYAVDDGVTEDLVCSLAEPADSPDLDEAERVALRFADLFATDHLAIDDTVYADLRRHFDEGAIVDLGLHCANFVGMGRLAATWSVTDALPERFRAPGRVTPWGPDAIVVG